MAARIRGWWNKPWPSGAPTWVGPVSEEEMEESVEGGKEILIIVGDTRPWRKKLYAIVTHYDLRDGQMVLEPARIWFESDGALYYSGVSEEENAYLKRVWEKAPQVLSDRIQALEDLVLARASESGGEDGRTTEADAKGTDADLPGEGTSDKPAEPNDRARIVSQCARLEELCGAWRLEEVTPGEFGALEAECLEEIREAAIDAADGDKAATADILEDAAAELCRARHEQGADIDFMTLERLHAVARKLRCENPDYGKYPMPDPILGDGPWGYPADAFLRIPLSVDDGVCGELGVNLHGYALRFREDCDDGGVTITGMAEASPDKAPRERDPRKVRIEAVVMDGEDAVLSIASSADLDVIGPGFRGFKRAFLIEVAKAALPFNPEEADHIELYPVGEWD